MSLFNMIKNQVVREATKEIRSEARQAVQGAVQGAASGVGKGKNSSQTFTFQQLPMNLAQLQSLPEASLDSAFKTTALCLAALCAFEKDENAMWEMLNFLKGPESVSEMEKQFIRERLRGKGYKTFSYFKGATPENGYVPTTPYTIEVKENPYSFDNENWATLYVTSGGADSPRGVKLRKKPSTGQWFINEIQCLSDVRIPVQEDPWA